MIFQDISSLTPVHPRGFAFFCSVCEKISVLCGMSAIKLALAVKGWVEKIGSDFCIDFQPALQVRRRGSSQPNLTFFKGKHPAPICTDWYFYVHISAVTHLQQSQVQRLCWSDFFVEV